MANEKKPRFGGINQQREQYGTIGGGVRRSVESQDVEAPERPDTQESERPSVQIPERPNAGTLERPDAQTFEHSDVQVLDVKANAQKTERKRQTVYLDLHLQI
ncbi:MAG: hypothetical protein ACRDHW_15935 [Ktedonobacteraceae bacterium]